MSAHEAGHLSIGEVLAQLAEDFPDVTISKIRFLESQGLIDPERTPSGYRKFYPADVERLLWILTQQKDNYLPLKVIKERLDDDGERTGSPRDGAGAGNGNGRPASTITSRPGDDAGGGASDGTTGAGLTRAELANAAGLDSAQVADLEAFGLLTPVQAGDRVLFDEEGLAVARAAAGFHRHGIEARHLRMYKSFADREATLFEQALLGSVRHRHPEARARARDDLDSLTNLGHVLRTALLRQALRDSLSE